MSKNILLYRLLEVLKFYFSTLALAHTAGVCLVWGAVALHSPTEMAGHLSPF